MKKALKRLLSDGAHQANSAADKAENAANTIGKDNADQRQVEPEHVIAGADCFCGRLISTDNLFDGFEVHNCQTVAGFAQTKQRLHNTVENKQNDRRDKQTNSGRNDDR